MDFNRERMRQHREALKERTNGKKGSQGWLASQIGAHPTSVSDWERGANEPSTRYVFAIAEALGVEARELVGSDEDEETSSMALLRDSNDLLAALAIALDPYHPRNSKEVAA